MTGSVTILAFGFGNLLMLGWLGAAAAPLLIHLWNKRRYRETPWAAIEFLMAAMRRNARRIQLQQWILLAVRTAIILLVVIAMAEPYLDRLGMRFTPGERTHRVLVVDGSFSMDYRPTDSSRFSRAKQLATQIVEESSQGDGFTLILMSDPPRVMVAAPVFEPNDFIDEIDALELPHTGGDLPATLALVDTVLKQSKKDHPGLEHHEVYFLTDLGKNSWVPDVSNGEQTTAFREQVERLSQEAALMVLDLGQSSSDNLAVTNLKPLESFATIGSDVTFETQVRNFGRQAHSRLLMELIVDGARVKEEHLDVGAGGDATISFTHRFETPGQHVVQVRLASDLLDIDNRRWFSLPVKPHLKVMCVSGKQGSTDYLISALDPEPSERSQVKPQVVPESALVEMDLTEFDCVFLCNVAQFTSAEARFLKAYLKQGGALVFFLGDQVLPQRYNRELAGEEEDSIRVLPARLGKIMAEAQYRFDPLDYTHPIVSIFRDRERSGLLTTPVYRYFQLEVPKTWAQSKVAMAFAGGDPAIVESPIDRGRSIVVATAASMASVDPQTQTPWTTMPAWPSFLPIVQELLSAAVDSQTEVFNTRVGNTLGNVVPNTAQGIVLTLKTPDGSKQPLRVKSEVDQMRWNFTDTSTSGIYRAEFDEPLSTSDPYAVNVDTSESDLTKADVDDLPSEFVVQTEWQNLDARPTADISGHSGLNRVLLYAALALLLMETFLAWLFGRELRA